VIFVQVTVGELFGQLPFADTPRMAVPEFEETQAKVVWASATLGASPKATTNAPTTTDIRVMSFSFPPVLIGPNAVCHEQQQREGTSSTGRRSR
jgi:hypothetical protein